MNEKTITIATRSSNSEIEYLRRELMKKLHSLENPSDEEIDMLFCLMYNEKQRTAILNKL